MAGIRVMPDRAVQEAVLRGELGDAGRKPVGHAIATGLIDVDGKPPRMHIALTAAAVRAPATHEVDAIAGGLEGGHESLKARCGAVGDAGGRAGDRADERQAAAAASAVTSDVRSVRLASVNRARRFAHRPDAGAIAGFL